MGYGLRPYEPDPPGTVGHGGEGIGYVSFAGCLPGGALVAAAIAD